MIKQNPEIKYIIIIMQSHRYHAHPMHTGKYYLNSDVGSLEVKIYLGKGAN